MFIHYTFLIYMFGAVCSYRQAVGTVLEGHWDQSGAILGNGGRSSPEALVVSSQAQRLGK